jgi:group I intron endonuclease
MATCQINGKQYIGQTGNFKRRQSDHLSDKTDGPFHRALRAHGSKSFSWIVIPVRFEDRDEIERLMIEIYNTEVPNGYNLMNGGLTCKKHHPLTIEKFKNRPEEYRKKLSAANLRNWQSPEYREKQLAKIKEAQKSRKPQKPRRKETKPRKPFSQEAIEKMRKAELGKPKSPDHIANMIKSLQRPEVKEKMRLAKLGKPSNNRKRTPVGQFSLFTPT